MSLDVIVYFRVAAHWESVRRVPGYGRTLRKYSTCKIVSEAYDVVR